MFNFKRSSNTTSSTSKLCRMAGQVPRVVSCSWSPSSTHVLYHCVCQSEIDARVFRSGQSIFHINGSPVKPVIEASLEGDRFHTSVSHCNFAINITCDGSSTRVSVDPSKTPVFRSFL